MKNLPSAIALTLLTVTFAQISSASAFQIDACAAYASGAVSQQRQNVQQACGFTGLRWHTSFSAHKAFCQSFGVQLSVVGNQDRQRDLVQCRANRFQNNEIIVVPNRFN